MDQTGSLGQGKIGLTAMMRSIVADHMLLDELLSRSFAILAPNVGRHVYGASAGGLGER